MRAEVGRAVALAAGLGLALLPCAAVAQSPADPAQRPGGREVPFPELPKPPPKPDVSAPLPVQPGVPTLGGPTLLVQRIVLEGNTVLPERAVREVASRYEGRRITSEELESLRLELTRLYVERGYISSGVIVPDQDVRESAIVLRAIEGRLAEIGIEGEELRLQREYLASRLRIGAGRVFNLNGLREAITILQQDGLIERINAEVLPGLERGETALRVRIDEAVPYQAQVSVNNHRNAGVGELRAEFMVAHANLSGRADRLEARVGATQGLDDFSLSYSVPLNAYDTRLSAQVSESDATVIDPALRALDIRSRAQTASVALEHPVWRTAESSVRLGVAYDRRKSSTFLLGVPFAFIPGLPEGRTVADVFRLSAAWLERKADEVTSARLQYSMGENNAESPKPAPTTPDARFSVWLGQLQWATRSQQTGAQLLARFEMQYTRDVLLAMERYGLGGAGTVRGFRENQLLRDRGQLLSVEYRHPVGPREGAGLLQVAPFFDYGRARVRDGTSNDPASIAGAGVGLLWSPGRHLVAQIYVARASRKFPVSEKAWQDRGVHFAVTWSPF